VDYKSDHTWLEKTIHNIAFAPWYPKLAISDFENSIYRSRINSISITNPVFITGLPRAGTTLLLELCVNSGEFASHTYKDMPFIFSPLLWDQVSRSFRNSGDLIERVHGDGIYINVESSESFEEVVWKEFWPSHYKQDRMIPWTGTKYPKFEDFFLDHMRKIILLRGETEALQRYISKNNFNIARIEYISNTFPDATILIPFRSPIQHASSLLRQHLNFLKIHKQDKFARKYMNDTGHFDFGENLRPINYDHWLSSNTLSNSNDLSFWLVYWINTYKYLVNHASEKVKFFSFDLLCEDPKTGLEQLGQKINIKNQEALFRNIDRIKAPKHFVIDGIDQDIINQANEILASLYEISNP